MNNSKLLCFVTLAIICALILYSCNFMKHNDYDDCTVYVKAHLNEKGDTLKFSDFFDTVQFVPVKCDELFVPEQPMRYYRGYYYVFDQSSERIFKISEDGTVVSKIGSMGHAANEYLGILSFDINPITSDVYVYDNQKNAIFVYSDDGHFVRSFSLDSTRELFSDFALLPNGNILGCDFDYEHPLARRGVWMTDSVGRFIKQVLQVDRRSRYDVGTNGDHLCKLGEDTVFVMGPIGDDAIYKIDSYGNVVTRYLFDFGSQISRKDLYHEPSIPLPDYFVSKMGFSVTNKAIFMDGFKGNAFYKFVFDKSLENCHVFSYENGVWIHDVPNFIGGAATDGHHYLDFIESEHLPSEIPNPDGVDLWMVITYLK